MTAKKRHIADARRPVIKSPGTASAEIQWLHLALSNAALCRSKDEARPVLCGVLLEAQHGRIRFIATDSFKLGTDTIAVDSRDFVGSILIDSGDVDRLLRLLKPLVRFSGPAILTFTPAAPGSSACLTVDAHGTSIIVKDLGAKDFPNWRNLFEATVDRVRQSAGAVVAGMNPVNVTALAKVRGFPGEKLNAQETGASCMVFRYPDDPSSPFLIEIGPSFRALLMPVRLPGSPSFARPPKAAEDLAKRAQEVAAFLADGKRDENESLALAEQLRDAAGEVERLSFSAAAYSDEMLQWIEDVKRFKEEGAKGSSVLDLVR